MQKPVQTSTHTSARPSVTHLLKTANYGILTSLRNEWEVVESGEKGLLDGDTRVLRLRPLQDLQMLLSKGADRKAVQEVQLKDQSKTIATTALHLAQSPRQWHRRRCGMRTIVHVGLVVRPSSILYPHCSHVLIISIVNTRPVPSSPFFSSLAFAVFFSRFSPSDGLPLGRQQECEKKETDRERVRKRQIERESEGW